MPGLYRAAPAGGCGGRPDVGYFDQLVPPAGHSCVPNIFKAEEKDFIKAAQRVYRSAQYQSPLLLDMLPGE